MEIRESFMKLFREEFQSLDNITVLFKWKLLLRQYMFEKPPKNPGAGDIRRWCKWGNCSKIDKILSQKCRFGNICRVLFY